MNIDTEGREIVITALVGSHNYNLNGKNSDKDYKHFVLPTFKDLYHGKRFSTAEQSDTVDYDVHDIRSLSDLLWKSNINFIEVLFSVMVDYDVRLDFLFRNPEKWATMNLPAFYNATMGMHIMKMKDLYKGTAKTKQLVETWGYDTKQACHAYRCLMVLEKFELHQSMKKALWFDDGSVGKWLLSSIKSGHYSAEQFNEMVESWMFNHGERVKEFYSFTQPKPELKYELDNQMFEFIRQGVMKE